MAKIVYKTWDENNGFWKVNDIFMQLFTAEYNIVNLNDISDIQVGDVFVNKNNTDYLKMVTAIQDVCFTFSDIDLCFKNKKIVSSGFAVYVNDYTTLPVNYFIYRKKNNIKNNSSANSDKSNLLTYSVICLIATFVMLSLLKKD